MEALLKGKWGLTILDLSTLLHNQTATAWEKKAAGPSEQPHGPCLISTSVTMLNYSEGNKIGDKGCDYLSQASLSQLQILDFGQF